MFRFTASVVVALSCAAGLLVALLALFLFLTPRPTNLRSCLTTKMHQVRLCPGEGNYVRLKSISSAARNAVIVSEDAAFYGHHGFDWSELQASLEKNLKKGQYARGGSTISQQLAKNVYLTPEKSITRKIREAIITLQIERDYSKDEILEKYLNVVEFGEKLYGIGPAARYYFKKSPANLTAAEGAFLAFLLPSPKKYAVSFHKKQLTPFARRQVQEIVDRMGRMKKISEAEHAQATSDVAVMFGEPAPVITEDEGLMPSAEEMPEEEDEVFPAPEN